MNIHQTLCELGAFLEGFEPDEESVAEVSLCECHGLADDGPTTAVVELLVETSRSEGFDIEFADTQVTQDGQLEGVIALPEWLVDIDEWKGTFEARSISLQGDGTLSYRLELTVPADTSGHESPVLCDDTTEEQTRTDESRESPSDADEGASTEAPAFRNPKLLREVYASSDTFAEMAGKIEMDVTAETVRRYMIDHDIHQPNSYSTNPVQTDQSDDDEGQPAHDTDSDTTPQATRDRDGLDNREQPGPASPEQSVILADGIGLPDSVTIDALIETVRTSNTIYEVKQEIDVGRDDALELLRELNLLDLVVGRLATEGERDLSRDQIVDRLREASAVKQSV